MAFSAGAIYATIVLNTSDFNQNAERSRNKIRELGQEVKMAGKMMSETGSRMIGLSATLLGPLALAVKSASNRNIELSDSMSALNTSMNEMLDTIVPSLIPWMNRLADGVQRVADLFNALPRQLRDNIVNFMAISGVLLLVGGVVLKLAGNLMRLATVMLLTPFGLFISGLAGILFLMYKFKDIADVVLGTFQIMFLFLKNGFLTITASMLDFVSGSLVGIAAVLEAMSKIPGPTQELFKGYAANMSNSAAIAHRAAFNLYQEAAGNAARIGEILKTGSSDWGEAFDELKGILADVDGRVSKVSSSFQTKFVKGLKLGLEELSTRFNDFKQLGLQTMENLANGMKTLFSDGIFNVLTGGIKNLQQVFADFGRSLLRMFSDIIAQLILANILKSMLGGMPIGAVDMGTWTKLPPQGVEGIADVPYTGLYKLHAGEEVVPRYDAGKSQDQPIIIHNFVTPESIAQAMSGKEGKGVIVNIIDANTSRGGQIRKSFKRG